MKFALVNPRWTYDGSIYFGCREPHLPLELGYTRALLQRDGHDVLLIDAHLHDVPMPALVERLEAFAPDRLVLTTAPTYLFWRCCPPELRVPHETLAACAQVPGLRVIVGPHASTTPQTTLQKLDADAAVLGECEEIVPRLAADPSDWPAIASIAWRRGTEIVVQGSPHACDMGALPALEWTDEDIRRHTHHHHRFDSHPESRGAEMEVSRGCPYHCSFCAKENFRNGYRKRPLGTILDELDKLRAGGVEYVYFIDEIFLPNRELLEALVPRSIAFGVQTRIDLWNGALLELLGRAGCVSIEAGVESITVDGREALDKGSRLTTDELASRLIRARRHVPFVQANLMESGSDDAADVAAWRRDLQREGVWANLPVPMFDYPGTPGYVRRWGLPDAQAWERALDDYLERFDRFSDIQEARPRRLRELEPWTHASSDRGDGAEAR